MDRFFDSLVELGHLLPRMVSEELRGIRNSFYYLIASYYVLSIVNLVTNSYSWTAVAGGFLWFASIFAIFVIRRIISVTATGEALEGLRITPIEEGVINSPLANLLWRLSFRIFLMATVCYLLIPVLPLRNNPLFVFLFPTFAVALALAFCYEAPVDSRARKWFQNVVAFFFIGAILLLFLFNCLALFPSLTAHFGMSGWFSGLMSSETAKIIQETEQTASQQREEAINRDLQAVQAWQQANPLVELPENYRIFIAGIRNGQRKTLAEVDQEISKKKAAEIDAANAAAKQAASAKKADDEAKKAAEDAKKRNTITATLFSDPTILSRIKGYEHAFDLGKLNLAQGNYRIKFLDSLKLSDGGGQIEINGIGIGKPFTRFTIPRNYTLENVRDPAVITLRTDKPNTTAQKIRIELERVSS